MKLTLASVVVAGVYGAGGIFAGATGAVSDNVTHLTGLASWLIDGWPQALGDLPGFLFRGVFSQSPALAVIVALLAATRRKPPATAWWVALMVVAVWAQPVLAGPDITGHNISRLWSVASIGVPAMAALLVGDADRRLSPSAAWAAGALMFAGSMHHQWSWPGQLLIQTPARFGLVHAAASGLAGMLVYAAVKPSRRSNAD